MAAELVKDWTANDWATKIEAMSPSGDGKIGVVFVRLKGETGNSFVIKPVGNPASALMGETLGQAVGGVESLNSVPYKVASPTGAAIKQALATFQQKEKVVKQKARWVNFTSAVNALPYLLVQDFVVAERLEDYRKGATLITLLSQESFLYGLGRLFAADAIMGNGDRLCAPNSGNIMFSRTADGQFRFYSIDTTTVLTNYDAVVNDPTTKTRAFLTMGHVTPQSWAKEFINPTGASRSQSMNSGSLPGAVPYPGEGATPATFAFDALFDHKNWWFTVFKPHFNDELKKTATHAYYVPSEKLWEKAYIHFRKGVINGIEHIDRVMSTRGGDGYGWLKAKFKLYKEWFGVDPNMDWMNLKIRRVYFRAYRAAFVKKHEYALAAMEAYVSRKDANQKKGGLNKYAMPALVSP